MFGAFFELASKMGNRNQWFKFNLLAWYGGSTAIG
jgi:hypothetical protein